MGVVYRKVKFLPICTFNCNNLYWNRKALLVSIVLQLWETINKYLGYNASGTDILCAITQKHQQVNSFIVHVLVQALQTMRLTYKIRKDVEISGNKMAEMARWISGT